MWDIIIWAVLLVAVIQLASVVLRISKWIINKINKRGEPLGAAIGQDIHRTVVSTSRSILELKSRSLGQEDAETCMGMLSCLCAFMGAMRDAYGITPERDSLADGYMKLIENKNYLAIIGVHDHLVSLLQREASERNFMEVFTTFMFMPTSYAFKPIDISHWELQQGEMGER